MPPKMSSKAGKTKVEPAPRIEERGGWYGYDWVANIRACAFEDARKSKTVLKRTVACTKPLLKIHLAASVPVPRQYNNDVDILEAFTAGDNGSSNSSKSLGSSSSSGENCPLLAVHDTEYPGLWKVTVNHFS
jgi:hypothetical protein